MFEIDLVGKDVAVGRVKLKLVVITKPMEFGPTSDGSYRRKFLRCPMAHSRKEMGAAKSSGQRSEKKLASIHEYFSRKRN